MEIGRARNLIAGRYAVNRTLFRKSRAGRVPRHIARLYPFAAAPRTKALELVATGSFIEGERTAIVELDDYSEESNPPLTMNRRQSYWRRNLVLLSATLGLRLHVAAAAQKSSADFRQPKVTDRHRAPVMHPTSASALIHGGLSAWSSYHLMGSWAKACPTARGFACVVREKVGADRHLAS